MSTPTTTKGPGALRLLRLAPLLHFTALFAEAVTHARLSREYYHLMTQEGLAA